MKPGVIGTGKMVEDALFATQPDADENENPEFKEMLTKFRSEGLFDIVVEDEANDDSENDR